MDDADEDLARFAAIMANIRLERLPELALSIRNSQATVVKDLSGCTVIQPPLYGAYHLVYVLKFSDDVRWALKVPVTGHHDKFDESAARALTTEASTMRLIARDTTVPVPKVYHFDSTLDNEIHCPFILMEFIDGKAGQDCWFDSSVDETVLEQRRTQTLQDTAKAMLQLNKFTYSLGGAPLFNEHGEPIGIGPVRTDDIDAALKRLSIEDSDDSPIYREIGPFNDLKGFMVSMLDQRQPPPDPFSQGMHKLLRLFIQWIPCDAREPGFVLTHPDLDIQNVLVAEDGALVGLIDWDGVAARPRALGNERFPSWLTRDWDPAKYAYGQTPDDDREAYLAHYRSMYLNCLRSFASKEDDMKLTHLPLLIENLQIAADDPICTDGIVEKIFDESLQARRLSKSSSLSSEKVEDKDGGEGTEKEDREEGGSGANDEEELYLYEFVTELVDDEFDPRRLQKVKEGFDALYESLERFNVGERNEDHEHHAA